jgi:hypothetical protein
LLELSFCARFVHSCGIGASGACALIEAAAASQQLVNCHIGGNLFKCISQLMIDAAWTEHSLPQPDSAAAAPLDHAFATALAGDVFHTISWVRR